MIVVAQFADELRMCRRRRSKVGNGIFLKLPFLGDDIADHHGRVAEITMPKKIDHIVKVARPGALRERPHLLAEQFLEGIIARRDPFGRRVGIGMRDRRNYRWQHHALISRKIEFDAGQVSAVRSDRSAIGKASLPRPAACLQIVDIEAQQLGRQLDAGRVVESGASAFETGVALSFERRIVPVRISCSGTILTYHSTARRPARQGAVRLRATDFVSIRQNMGRDIGHIRPECS
jgi:hypothetical protein